MSKAQFHILLASPGLDMGEEDIEEAFLACSTSKSGTAITKDGWASWLLKLHEDENNARRKMNAVPGVHVAPLSPLVKHLVIKPQTSGGPSVGLVHFSDSSKWEGQVLDDLPFGKGIYTYANAIRYVGEIMNGQPHGMGRRTKPIWWKAPRLGLFSNGHFKRSDPEAQQVVDEAQHCANLANGGHACPVTASGEHDFGTAGVKKGTQFGGAIALGVTGVSAKLNAKYAAAGKVVMQCSKCGEVSIR
jgi:hypothetical protein